MSDYVSTNYFPMNDFLLLECHLQYTKQHKNVNANMSINMYLCCKGNTFVKLM